VHFVAKAAPAVIYGGNQDPVAIHVEEKELRRQLGTGKIL
jgi:large subunit ribosomal protein L25